MEGPGKLVATLCLHSLHIGAMEGVESKVLHFSIVLTTERERVRDGLYILTQCHSTVHGITIGYLVHQIVSQWEVHAVCVRD